VEAKWMWLIAIVGVVVFIGAYLLGAATRGGV